MNKTLRSNPGDRNSLNNSANTSPGARRKQIMNHLIRYGSTNIEDLAEKLGVSRMTIYRDISTLEANSLLIRRRGEVTPTQQSLSESTSTVRTQTNLKEKASIGAAAQAHIRHCKTLLLDDSSTNLALLDYIPQLLPLTIVTNSQFIADEVKKIHGAHLVLLGGEYVDWADSYFGDLTIRSLQGIRVDACVMSNNAIAHGKCYHPDERVAQLKRAMMRAAHMNILLADNSKFGRSAFYEVSKVTDFDLLITDADTPETVLQALRKSGMEIEVAASLA
ncbi:MAG: DeoR/GlpR family DNA-binding transcription regulator [Arcanobacterium sp.]|nr:DeoR/GlpR family DNA-binding transcription regulator [Arcanobacterium sp.]